jgi:hypothetical protein
VRDEGEYLLNFEIGDMGNRVASDCLVYHSITPPVYLLSMFVSSISEFPRPTLVSVLGEPYFWEEVILTQLLSVILDQADEDDELEWYIPQAIVPSELQLCYNVISQFLETPFDLNGKKAAELLRKKRAPRRRRRRSPSTSDEAELSDEDAPTRKKRQKKQKEQLQYKSAQFIEDSDEEYGDMEAFLEKEKVQRERAALAAAMNGGSSERPIGMRATGTKKRKRRNKGEEASGNAPSSAEDHSGGAQPGGRSSPSISPAISDKDDSDPSSNSSGASDSGASDDDGNVVAAPHRKAKVRGVSREGTPASSKPRPKPRPVPRRKQSSDARSPSQAPVSSGDRDAYESSPRARPPGGDGGDSDPGKRVPQPASPPGDDGPAVAFARRAKRLVLEDSDEE